MRLESACTPEQCGESLRAALKTRKTPVRGFVWGNLFRLTLLEQRSFRRRNGVSYTAYGRIRERMGRTEITCLRFPGFSDPLKFLLLYAVVQIILLIDRLWEPFTWRVPFAALTSCFAVMFISLLRVRTEKCEELRGTLRAFLCENLPAREIRNYE